MPKDSYRREDDSRIARRASNEIAKTGKLRSFDPLEGDPAPPTISSRITSKQSIAALQKQPSKAPSPNRDGNFLTWINRISGIANSKGNRIPRLERLPQRHDQYLLGALLMALKSADSYVANHDNLARTFRILGESATRALVAQLNAPTRIVQKNTALTLCRIATPDPWAISRLRQLTGDKNADVRRACARTLAFQQKCLSGKRNSRIKP